MGGGGSHENIVMRVTKVYESGHSMLKNKLQELKTKISKILHLQLSLMIDETVTNAR